jgi:hypothetical protein
MPIDKARASENLHAFDFKRLFVDELGWDNPASRQSETVIVGDAQFTLAPVAEKRGVRIFHCSQLPERAARQRIEREVAKLAREHLIIFTDEAKTRQVWQWVAREKGRPAAFREHLWLVSQSPDPLLQKLDHIAFSLDEEEGLTLFGTTVRMRDAFDRERITRRFYEEFKRQHEQFLGFIKGLTSTADKAWYASLMLNRLMFVYFIQKKRFLNGDIDYLKTKLAEVRAEKGDDQFHTFYRAFLLKLFHGGLATPANARDADTARMLGSIPYLNGGLFEPHALEADGNDIQIADAAFEDVFAFFDQYEWTLDTRAIERADGREINPDVLGHIFEKYINQKQMGAYYTKEDITDYITKNTVIPWLFQNAIAHDKVAFEPGSAVWRMLSENPDAYIYPAVKHGTDQPLPDNIAAGIADVAQRGDWNRTAPATHGLPTETWRELVARRERYASIKAKAAGVEISSIEDFITLNLDIRQFARDAIQYAESPDLVRAFWKGISAIKVLDPACGSGAFLFAALNILYDLYDACLERMEQFVESAPEGSGPRQLYSDFRTLLDRIERHPNRPYFIYKSIILDNLYGVDIMDEAVEICKLRLFLKLASQLERADQIEPLPDIDFNIRAGNSLIGYTSMADVRKATEAKGFDFDDRAGKIEAAAQDLDAAFQLFRQQQTELHGVVNFPHKNELRTQLMKIVNQLDRFIANDYGFKVTDGPTDNALFEGWKISHKPFHWLVEFHAVLSTGGFDIIVGNPPYVQKSKIKQYRFFGFDTDDCPDIYAPFIERGNALLGANGLTGLIVPISFQFSNDFDSVRTNCVDNLARIWVSCFSRNPAALFSAGLGVRSTIMIATKSQPTVKNIFSTRLYRWVEEARDKLFQQVDYLPLPSGLQRFGWPRLDNAALTDLLAALAAQPGQFARERSAERHKMRFKTIALYYISAFSEDPPSFDGRGRSISQTSVGEVRFASESERDAALAITLGKIALCWWAATGDDFHVTAKTITSFPLALSSLSPQARQELAQLGQNMREEMKSHVIYTNYAGKKMGNYDVKRLRNLTDTADRIVLKDLGLEDRIESVELAYDRFMKMTGERPGTTRGEID